MSKVSVIIPVFNTEKYIGECLDSILNQTLKDIEIICVNDGSFDHSLEILRDYEKKYEQITVIDQVNSGQSAARNKALKTAAGKYIYFMDSDDKVSSHMLAELWDKCEENDLDVIYFSGASFFENKLLEEEHADFKNNYLRDGEYPEMLGGPEMFVKLQNNNDYSMSPCLQLIRKEHLQKHDIWFPEGIIHEDNCFSFMVLLKAERTLCVNDIYFYRRIREESVMTRGVSERNLRGYFTCYLKQMEFAGQLDIDDPDVIAKIEWTLWMLNLHVQDIYMQLTSKEKEKFLSTCSPYERYFFKTAIFRHIQSTIELNRTIDGLTKKNKRLRKRKQGRLKRIILKPWKLIKGGVRCWRMHGFGYTVKQIFRKTTSKFK